MLQRSQPPRPRDHLPGSPLHPDRGGRTLLGRLDTLCRRALQLCAGPGCGGSDGPVDGVGADPYPLDAQGSSDGQVESLALRPDGSTLYAGGLFTAFGGQSRPCLAALDPETGAADGPDFQLGAGPGTSCEVRALVFSADAHDLYLGGGFDSAGGAVRHRVAAVDLSSWTGSDVRRTSERADFLLFR